MGVDELHLFDLYAPIVKEVEMGMSYPEASEQIIASVEILGPSYQESLKRGLTSRGGWTVTKISASALALTRMDATTACPIF